MTRPSPRPRYPDPSIKGGKHRRSKNFQTVTIDLAVPHTHWTGGIVPLDLPPGRDGTMRTYAVSARA